MRNSRFTLFALAGLLFYGCKKDGDGNAAAVPSAPSNLTALPLTTTTIILTWTDNSSDEKGFKVQRKTGSGSFEDIGNTDPDQNSFSDMSFNPNTTYTYRVYSYNDAGNSTQSSNEVALTSPLLFSFSAGPDAIDINGNIYPSISISCGSIWTTKNLNVNRYRNGDVIPQVTNATQWAALTTGAWCWFNNDSVNYSQFGRLYNWYAVNDPRGLAPLGWHIPAEPDWNKFVRCIDPGMDTICMTCSQSTYAGQWMKTASGWTDNNMPGAGNGDNSSGFTGIPGGERIDEGFSGIDSVGVWWSADQFGQSACVHWISYGNGSEFKWTDTKYFGHSIRLVKD